MLGRRVTMNRSDKTSSQDGCHKVNFSLNDKTVSVRTNPVERLSKVLREELGFTGTKVGCDAGDCGACTILLNERAVCACMVPVGRVNGSRIRTIEGLSAEDGQLSQLQRAFLHFGAAQCGICTPAMLMSATALLQHNPVPSQQEVQDALGGVLCRCTGYGKIIAAVMNASTFSDESSTLDSMHSVGARVLSVDGTSKVNGTAIFGADDIPDNILNMKVIRSPFHRAKFSFGDLTKYVNERAGIVRIFTADDVPGENRFGVIPEFSEQPVFAEKETRFRGEAVAAVVGEPSAIDNFDISMFPVIWDELNAVLDPDQAQSDDATLIHENRRRNILTSGFVQKGEINSGFAAAKFFAEVETQTGFIEHAYIEPEAGFARRIGDRIEVQACTQAPHMDLAGLARILGVATSAIRIIPTAVGGGFGSKLDLSLQPLVAIAAWHLDRPVRLNYTRAESMMSTTKRHPSRIEAKAGVDKTGKLTAMTLHGVFNTGAYASWGPTVANRVPIHASGPYFIPNYLARSIAVHTNCVPAGAFRGFGVPQTTIAQEVLFDKLAHKIGMDRLEFRLMNALENGTPTVTGQVFDSGVGIKQCLLELKSYWRELCHSTATFNESSSGTSRRGIGVAGVWYGCGNTSLPNPSTIRVGVDTKGKVILFQGAIDIGQGSNTVIAQICADSIGVELAQVELVSGDTDQTPDAGKTSASRQTFVSGKACYLASTALRKKILDHAEASNNAQFQLVNSKFIILDGDRELTLDLTQLPADERGLVFCSEATYDPPTTEMDSNGQGEPYATFGYGAQIVELEVDLKLGTVKVLNIVAAHDVGRAINPTLVEGQVEGGIAQGLGMALMEEYIPGRTENLHDYLIPTFGDMPNIKTIIVEQPDPHGPFGAKGLGEHVLIPTAPAIVNAIFHATGSWILNLPATPDKVLQAIKTQSHIRK